MRVPLLDLNEQLRPLRDELLAALTEVLDSTCYIMGPKVEALERDLAAYCQAGGAVGVASGTDALLAALMALRIGPGDLVLTTPYTFVATVGCILRLGARPVFADIDPVTFNLDPALAGEVLARPEYRGRIKAILPVHLFGQCADLAPIMALAEEHGLPVVEDAAQAIGAVYPWPEAGGQVRWRRAGSVGTAGCFSFFPSKNLGGIGDGGMITVSDAALRERIRIIRVHGGEPKYHHPILGGNFRLDPIQAAALSVKLPHLPAWHRARRRNAARYQELFFAAGLPEAGEVILPQAVYAHLAKDDEQLDHHIYNQYVIRARRRDELKDHLLHHGIGCEIYYPIPMHQQGCVAHLDLQGACFPEAERAARETLALPIYPELTFEMQAQVVKAIVGFYQK
ncbi:MAG: DegT/DnrJ/EryC1/StrS family aminotransferase [Desulfobacteraceae bacterium]|nr:DegT/DnrJ/EryC1/StrS family aminotransferase [Desulfobacteraceae bacterium]